MADTKITGLTANTVPTTDDLLVTVDDPSGTPTTKKSTVGQVINGLFKVLSADDTGGQNTTSAQPVFPTSGGVTVLDATTYKMEGYFRISRAAGTTSHTTSVLFAGTATLDSIFYTAMVKTGDTGASAAVNSILSEVATAVVVKSASTSATEQIGIFIKGIVRVTTGGTIIPQFQYSSAPGGTPTILKNSYFQLIPLGNSSVATQGTWS